jgi:hypothetical protein
MRKTHLLFTFAFAFLITGAALAQEDRVASLPLCCAPIPAGTVDWWTFDEPSGPSSADFAGAVNNAGTDTGPVAHVAGMVGRARQYNGTNTYTTVADQLEVNFDSDCGPGTIDFWIRTDDTGTVNVLDKRQSTGTNFLRGYSVYLWQGKLGFQMATGPGNFSCNSGGSACLNATATSLPAVNDNKWHFVAISFSRCNSAAATFYVDGQTQAFTPRNGILTNTAPLLIGRQAPSMGGAFFRGAIDELEIAKSVVPAAALNAIRLAGPNGKCRRYAQP